MSNGELRLYRRRYIPDENILLKDDEILQADDELIVTKWKVLKPRKDIAWGISAYYMRRNFKISKIFNKDGKLVYWYCDIIFTEHPDEHTYIFHDLLVDVIIEPDGFVRVVDLDEIADILEKAECLNKDLVITAMRATNDLLNTVYNHQFEQLTKIIEDYQ